MLNHSPSAKQILAEAKIFALICPYIVFEFNCWTLLQAVWKVVYKGCYKKIWMLLESLWLSVAATKA